MTSVPAAGTLPAFHISQIDSIFAPFNSPNAPGAAVLVLQHGQPVFRRGYGITDLRTLTPIGSETNFRLASVTKQFTAAAIMLLVHDRKLNYDDHLNDFFPDFPPYGRSITLRQLLNHTSGLPDYEDLLLKCYPGQLDHLPQILDDGVLKLLADQTDPKFPAGSKWDYSNSGYAVLAMIVEKVSGATFGEFLHNRVFLPLQMQKTVAYLKGSNEVPHRAFGHTSQQGTWRETDQSPTSAVLGDGGIYSSIDDLARWDRALRDDNLLTKAETQPALAPAVLPDGTKVSYGYGWGLDPYRGHQRMWHAGTTIGFRTAIHRFPEAQLSIIVLANRADLDAPAIALQVADLFLPADGPMPPDSTGVVP